MKKGGYPRLFLSWLARDGYCLALSRSMSA